MELIICGRKDHRSNYIDGGKLPDKCGDCGGPVESGFGLAYGGYGSYVTCAGECEWHAKLLLDPKSD